MTIQWANWRLHFLSLQIEQTHIVNFDQLMWARVEIFLTEYWWDELNVKTMMMQHMLIFYMTFVHEKMRAAHKKKGWRHPHHRQILTKPMSQAKKAMIHKYGIRFKLKTLKREVAIKDGVDTKRKYIINIKPSGKKNRRSQLHCWVGLSWIFPLFINQ